CRDAPTRPCPGCAGGVDTGRRTPPARRGSDRPSRCAAQPRYAASDLAAHPGRQWWCDARQHYGKAAITESDRSTWFPADLRHARRQDLDLLQAVLFEPAEHLVVRVKRHVPRRVPVERVEHTPAPVTLQADERERAERPADQRRRPQV